MPSARRTRSATWPQCPTETSVPLLEAALEAMAVGPVLAPDRRCLAGERCLYTVDGDGYTMDVVLADPFDFDRGTVSEVPSGYVEVSITLHAF